MVYRASKLSTWLPFAVFVTFSIASLKCWPVALLFMIQSLWYLAHLGQKMTVTSEGFTFTGRNSLLISRKYQFQWKEIAYIEETSVNLYYRFPRISILNVYDKDSVKRCSIRVDWFKDEDLSEFVKLLKKKKKYKNGGRALEKKILVAVVCICAFIIILFKMLK